MTKESIIDRLPYRYPFLFVDKIIEIDDKHVRGTYTFLPSLPFYEGHFIENPVTPGVILTETMAQIGVVCMGVYLLDDGAKADQQLGFQIAMSSSAVDYYVPVWPGDTVTVLGVKEYWRFGKLKCKVEMYNEDEDLVCRGTISGMIKSEG